MTPSNNDPSTEGWNLLFKKFVSIWVWSILFSSITGLGISYMQVSTVSKIPDFHGISLFVTLIQLLIILAAAIIAVIAYINLFHYFRLSILPILVDVDVLEGMGNYEPSVRTRKSLFALTKAYKLLIASGVIRMASWFIDYLYSSFLELLL